MASPYGSSDPAQQLVPYLRPREQLLWSGRPDPTVRFAPADAFLVPFSVLSGGFAIYSLLGRHPSSFCGVSPFVAVGVYFIFGRFVHKKRTKLKTAYGIASDRAHSRDRLVDDVGFAHKACPDIDQEKPRRKARDSYLR
jgi:hypothetical protein